MPKEFLHVSKKYT